MASLETFGPIQKTVRTEFEYYGSALTMNTALRVVCVVLALLVAGCVWQIVRLSNVILSHGPLVVRVSEAGRAELVDYRYGIYTPQDAEVRYFLNQFLINFYSREHRTVRDMYPTALSYLSGDMFSRVQEADRKTQWEAKFLSSSDDDVSIQVGNIAFDDIQKPIYRAVVAYTKIFHSSAGPETKREQFTDTLYFRVDPKLAQRDTFTLLHNPLGFAIFSFHPDQAFQ